jgi:hypothetical protein
MKITQLIQALDAVREEGTAVLPEVASQLSGW